MELKSIELAQVNSKLEEKLWTGFHAVLEIRNLYGTYTAS